MPPEIEVQNSGYHIPQTSLDTTYWVNVQIHDPAGVDRATLVKDGNKEKTEAYAGGTTVYDTLEFTEKLAESETDIDTSSRKSTFISFGSKVTETVGSVAESVGDTTAGTTVYVESSDTNDNSQQVVGVQRANFYSEAAGGLYTGTLIDQAVASEFGTISGFSSSLGVVFQDISQLIDDPTAVVEGTKALLALVQEEQLGAAETLVDVMVQSAKQKQALNNPYGSLEKQEHPELYNTFRASWYEGYAAGFLVKTALGGAGSSSAKATIKSTDAVQDISSRLADTRALRALSRIEDATDAAKGRATVRILLATDGDAAEPLLSQADTAGSAYRLWRHQRAMDADVEALSETRQARLAQTLSNADADAKSAIRRMDQDELDDLTGLYIDPAVRAGLAPKYADLDATKRQQLTSLIGDSDPGTARVASKVDTDRLDNLLELSCGLSGTSSRQSLSLQMYSSRPKPAWQPSLSNQRYSNSYYSAVRIENIKSARCSGGKLLETVATDADITGAELDNLLSRIDKSQIKPFANSVVESKNPSAYLDDLNPIAVKRMTEDADNDGVFRRVSRTYDKYNLYKDNYNTDGPNDLAEIYGEVLLEQKLGNNYRVISQAEVKWKDVDRKKEIDHLIINDGQVIGFGETKDSTNANAAKQVRKTKTQLKNLGIEEIRYKGSSDPVDATMTSDTIDENYIYTIGNGEKYDIQSLSSATFEALYNGFQGDR